MNLFRVEVRRALHRRVVRGLVAVALLGCAIAGVIAFADSTGKSLAELHANGQTHPAVVRDWWIAGRGDGALAIASFFLLLGGFVGGASVAGAEWSTHSMAAVLTWEPRRVRLHLTRTAACGVVAALIALALQVVFLAAFLPAVLAHGATGGTDAAWWVAIAAASARTCLLTAVAAVLGVSLATLGRNTSFALVVVFAWVVVIEGAIRALDASRARFLWGENLTIVLTWARLDRAAFERGPGAALLTVMLYASTVVAAAALTFRRRDVTGAA